MTLSLPDERRAEMRDRLMRFFQEEFDESLSDFRADSLLDEVIRQIGPAIYNQAVADVRKHLQTKLDDLDGEVYFEG